MQVRDRGVVSIIAVMAVVGLAVPSFGSGEPTQELVVGTDPASGRGYTSWVSSEISTGEDVWLQLTKFEKSFRGTEYSYIEVCPGYASIPEEVPDDGTKGFCYASLHDAIDFKDFDTGFTFHYDILIPDRNGGWRQSGCWVDGATKVPMIGERKIDCTIKRSGSTDRATDAPFSCATSWEGEGHTSEPHWKITTKPLQVIDASDSAQVNRAAQLIGDNCTLSDTPRCVWTRTQKSSAFLVDRDHWQSLTNWADSCPPTDPDHLFVLHSSRNVQISWTDKVGGKISAKVSGDVLVYKVEGAIEVSYEHSITQSDSYGEGYTYTIPYNYRSALYLQHGMLEVSGDFSILTKDGRFLVKNAVFRFPLQRDVQVEGRGQRVPRGVVVHVDIPCSEDPPPDGAPPPEGARVGTAGVTRVSETGGQT